jgi:putative nucleotidyltransferase with HDIG domain
MAAELESFENFLSKNNMKVPERATPPVEEKDEQTQKRELIIQAVEAKTKDNLDKVLTPKGLSEETVVESKQLVSNYVKMLSKDKNAVFDLLAQIAESDFLAYHFTATSLLSIYICRLLKEYGERLQEIVGLGGYLHDVGKIKIISDLKLDINSYNEAEIDEKIYKDHPKVGLEMIGDYKSVGEEVKQIIYQHHESPNGSGFPLGLTTSKIYFPASIVSVGNTFAKHIGPEPYGMGMSPRDAIKQMLSDEGRLYKHIMKPLTQLYRV